MFKADLQGKVIGNHIFKLLPDHRFDVKDCRGQAYDAAAVMSSQTKGALSVIKNDQPLAYWVHCRNHCINLAIAFACKNTSVTNFMDSLTSVCCYFSNYPKRHQHSERFIDYYKDELSVAASSPSHVIGLSKTRWVERYKTNENYYLLFKLIVATFDSICNPNLCEEFYKYLENETIENLCWDSESINKAQGLFAVCRKFYHIVAFSVLFHGFEPTKSLVTKLQKRHQDIYQAYCMIDKVLSDLRDI